MPDAAGRRRQMGVPRAAGLVLKAAAAHAGNRRHSFDVDLLQRRIPVDERRTH
jgi:hypothetical protein